MVIKYTIYVLGQDSGWKNYQFEFEHDPIRG